MMRFIVKRLHMLCFVVLMICVSSVSKAYNTLFDIDWQHITIEDGAVSPQWSPDGERLAFLTRNLTKISVFNFQTGEVEYKKPLIDQESLEHVSIAWNSDGKYLAVSMLGVVYLIDSNNGDLIHTYSFNQSDRFTHIGKVQWVQDPNLLAVFDIQGYIYILDTLTHQTLRTIEFGNGHIVLQYSAFDWRQDAALFAAPLINSQDSIGFWDLDGNLVDKYITGLDQYGKSVTACRLPGASLQDLWDLSWSNDGKTLAVGDYYGVTLCTFIDPVTIQMRTIEGNGTLYANSFGLTWSPDGHWLVNTGWPDPSHCSIRVYDTSQNYELVRVFDDAMCETWGWRPNGKFLATGDDNGLWIGAIKER